MAGFTSYDSIINALTVLNKGQEARFVKTSPASEVAGATHTTWAFTGDPVPGTWIGTGGSVSTTMAHCNSTTVGALPIASPTTASGENLFITTVGAMPNVASNGMLVLVDRLADTGALTTTTGSSCIVTMPTGGAWERFGDGVGVMACVESLAGTPTAGSIFTLTYTNSDGTPARVSSQSLTSSTTLHRTYGSGLSMGFALQGADVGIQSIQSIGVSGVTPANLAIVVFKVLATIPMTSAYQYSERDLVIQTPKLPKLPISTSTADTSSCLQWVVIPGTTSAVTINGSISLVAG